MESERKPKYFREGRKGFWLLKCGYNRGFRAVYTIEEERRRSRFMEFIEKQSGL